MLYFTAGFDSWWFGGDKITIIRPEYMYNYLRDLAQYNLSCILDGIKKG
jgi:hypothetical protein